MKKLFFILFLFPFVSFSQTDCDTNLCVKYADLNSFEIIQDKTVKESSGSVVHMYSCDMLCAIENARSTEEIIFEWDNYVIRIFPIDAGEEHLIVE